MLQFSERAENVLCEGRYRILVPDFHFFLKNIYCIMKTDSVITVRTINSGNSDSYFGYDLQNHNKTIMHKLLILI